LHSNAVYRNHHGDVPKGYVVHHKNGRHDRIEDDAPENLLLLPDEWNLRFLPVLAKGFGVREKIITDLYLTVMDKDKTSTQLFSDLCAALINKTKEHDNEELLARKKEVATDQEDS
jgi:hypothetical protein